MTVEELRILQAEAQLNLWLQTLSRLAIAGDTYTSVCKLYWEQSKAKQSKAKQSKAKQSKAKQSKAKQSKAKQSIAF